MQANRIKQKWSLALLVGSLLLLVFMLSWNLIQQYDKEKIGLMEKMQIRFDNDLQEFRDSLIFKGVQHRFFKEFAVSDQSMNARVLEVGDMPWADFVRDSVKLNAVKITRSENHPARVINLAPSAAFGSDSLQFEYSVSDDIVFSEIDTLISVSVENSNFPKSYKLIINGEEIQDAGSFSFSVFDDPLSDENVFVSFDNYKKHVLEAILPEILLSVLIISLIIAAYYLMFAAHREQRKLARLKDAFVSNITHELKTPIATVGVALEAIRDFNVIEDKQKTEDYVDMARKELTRLQSLVEQVLTSGQMGNNALSLNKERTDISQLIDQTIKDLEPLLKEKNVELEVIGSKEDVSYLLDPEHFKNVFINFIDNAIKYSTGTPKIKVSFSKSQDSLMITFSDSGQGIPREFQKQVFERFFRVPNENIHNVKGHGLGLSYAKMIVENHGGQIELDSQEGEGASFTIKLPK